MNDKFTVTYGQTGNSKQVIFYYASKVNAAELEAMYAREFPGVSLEKLNFFPGYVSCVVTTGKDLEVPTV